MTLAICHSSSDIITSYFLIDLKWVIPFKVISWEKSWVLPEMFQIVYHNAFDKWKNLRSFQGIYKRTHHYKLFDVMLVLLSWYLSIFFEIFCFLPNERMPQSQKYWKKCQNNSHSICHPIHNLNNIVPIWISCWTTQIANNQEEAICCLKKAKDEHIPKIVLEMWLISKKRILRDISMKMSERI